MRVDNINILHQFIIFYSLDFINFRFSKQVGLLLLGESNATGLSQDSTEGSHQGFAQANVTYENVEPIGLGYLIIIYTL